MLYELLGLDCHSLTAQIFSMYIMIQIAIRPGHSAPLGIGYGFYPFTELVQLAGGLWQL